MDGDTFILPAAEITAERDDNTRHYEVGSGVATYGEGTSHHDLTDEQLQRDIAENGQLQAVGVWWVEERWRLVWGFRRHACCARIASDFPVLCRQWWPPEESPEPAYEAVMANLRENIHRRSLRAFELAEALHRMHHLRPDLSKSQLACDIGVSTSYAWKLLHVRSKSAAPLWQLFVRYGMRLGRVAHFDDMVEIVRLPKSEQVAAWRALLAGRRPRKHKQRQRAISPAQARVWLRQVDELDAPAEFRNGARYVLECVLRRREWLQSAP